MVIIFSFFFFCCFLSLSLSLSFSFFLFSSIRPISRYFYYVHTNCSFEREREGRIIKVAYRFLYYHCILENYLNKKKIKGAAHFYLQLSLELNSLKSNTRIHLKDRERGHRENVLFHFFFFLFSGWRKSMMMMIKITSILFFFSFDIYRLNILTIETKKELHLVN